MSRKVSRANSSVLRVNSLRVLSRQESANMSDIPIITSPHFESIPQYEVEDHDEQIDVSKSSTEQTIKRQSIQSEKDDVFFLPFFDVDFTKPEAMKSPF